MQCRESSDAIQQRRELSFLFSEIRFRDALWLVHLGKGLQAPLGMLLGIRPLLGSPLVVCQQHQGPRIIRVDCEQPVRRVHNFGLITRLLVGPHQQFQRIFLHHAVGVLSEKRFQSADLGSRVCLLNRADVCVVFGRVLDLLLLRLA